MSVMAHQITGVSMVCTTVCSGADQTKHQSSASLAFMRGIRRWSVNSPHKGPVTRKIFPFDDVIMFKQRKSTQWFQRCTFRNIWTSYPQEFPHHDDVTKWKYFPRYWHFMRGIHRSLVNSLHKSQWRGTLMFSLICAWINIWINNHETGDLIRQRAHYDVTVMRTPASPKWYINNPSAERAGR